MVRAERALAARARRSPVRGRTCRGPSAGARDSRSARARAKVSPPSSAVGCAFSHSSAIPSWASGHDARPSPPCARWTPRSARPRSSSSAATRSRRNSVKPGPSRPAGRRAGRRPCPLAGQDRARHQVEQEGLGDRGSSAHSSSSTWLRRALLRGQLLGGRRPRASRGSRRLRTESCTSCRSSRRRARSRTGTPAPRPACRAPRRALARLALLVGRGRPRSPSRCSTAGRAPAASWPRPTGFWISSVPVCSAFSIRCSSSTRSAWSCSVSLSFWRLVMPRSRWAMSRGSSKTETWPLRRSESAPAGARARPGR